MTSAAEARRPQRSGSPVRWRPTVASKADSVVRRAPGYRLRVLVIEATRSLDRGGSLRAHRLAGRLAGSPDRPGPRARAPRPGRAWTIAALAREVAMSRSAFAARFADARRGAPHRLPDALADAGRCGRDRRRPANDRRVGQPAGLPLRCRVRTRVQARDRRAARRSASDAGMSSPPGPATRLETLHGAG